MAGSWILWKPFPFFDHGQQCAGVVLEALIEEVAFLREAVTLHPGGLGKSEPVRGPGTRPSRRSSLACRSASRTRSDSFGAIGIPLMDSYCMGHGGLHLVDAVISYFGGQRVRGEAVDLVL